MNSITPASFASSRHRIVPSPVPMFQAVFAARCSCRAGRSAYQCGLPAALLGSADGSRAVAGGRAGLFLGVIITTLLTSLSAYGHNAVVVVVLGAALAVAANIGVYLVGFRVLTPKGIPARKLVPGAVAGGAGWTVLQAVGSYLVHHFLHTESVYGVFATVLGLLAWIYLAVQISVYAAEINVVLARRLWPRSIVQPPLTEADRAVLAVQALQNQRRDDQHVEVSFDDRPANAAASSRMPGTPDEVALPAQSGPSKVSG